ncbi:MAG: hypothetical protein BIFFINMI_04067 [Phycisphaerae bacterium]|nr:hypothetical protein [Phycisphaerae bacterium]
MSSYDSSAISQVRALRTPGGVQAVVVTLQGEVDLQHSPAVRQQLIDEAGKRPGRLVVDLSAVNYMDSSGVASLVETLQRVRGYGGELILVNPTARVRSIFEIARLDRIFRILTDLGEAMGE